MFNLQVHNYNSMKIFKFLLFFGFLIGLTSCASGKFTNHQKKLIEKADASTSMRLFLITNQTDSILLRKKSKFIKPNLVNKTLNLFSNRLITTVKESQGVGIAAPQVGVLKNMIVVQRLDKDNEPFEVYLNPVITKYSDKKRPCPEGCLSIPNERGTTQNRAFTVYLEYDTMEGKHVKEAVNDFTSVIFQHEIDHLNGILFIDHLEKEMR